MNVQSLRAIVIQGALIHVNKLPRGSLHQGMYVILAARWICDCNQIGIDSCCAHLLNVLAVVSSEEIPDISGDLRPFHTTTSIFQRITTVN